jgi:hypothetical protein
MFTNVSEERTEWIFSFIPTLKMEVICSSETSVTTYMITLRQNLEDYNLHFHSHENLRSHLVDSKLIQPIWSIHCKPTQNKIAKTDILE